MADLPGDLARPTPPVPAAEDEDGLLPIEQSLASALWTRWADPEGGPVIVIMDDPGVVARSLREWLAANTRPDAPVAAGGGLTEWGVACPLDDDVIPTADPDWSVRHHDRNCGPGHRLVRRTVTDWTPAEEDDR